ncbi:sorting nexin-25 isoform X2 [Agrilus planipennis]|uniref:Sorting nexin-25 isoform X2 n=1 Tax=Agrilus planipennis TaxID=224129 RepID=A0A1W4X6P7_AGRPL|nr:sorting nexin-25 isoform X2 [Agrilus planipennis]
MNKSIIIVIGLSALSLTCFPLCLSIVCMLVLTACIAILAVYCIVWIHIMLSSPHKTGTGNENIMKELENFRSNLMHNGSLEIESPQSHLPVIFGRTVDSVLHQLLDYIVRDFILVYLKDYAYKPKPLTDTIKEDLWGSVQILSERISRVDHVKLIACDMVNKITLHFEKIRAGESLVIASKHLPLFSVSPHLVSEEKELSYLRNVSELLIMFLLPRSYSLSPSKYLVRELLTCKVLKPFIDTITDPDYFNQNVVVYIETQRSAAAMHKKTFEYANSFEDFLKLIQKTNDLELLKRIRYDIVTKIMQATTLQNLKRAKGFDPDIEKSTSGGINKSEVNAAKKLKRYISQLTYAKGECEKRMKDLGWDLNYHIQNDNRNILPLMSILEHVLGRKYFSQFLETVASQGLIGYWSSVEELRTAPRKNWHQLGAEIFYTFIRNPTAEIKVDKSTRKRMEAFLLGDKGPEVFYEVQEQVVKTLEDKYYQPFVISDFYKQMLSAMANDEAVSEVDSSVPYGDIVTCVDSGGKESGLHVEEYSGYAKRKLDQLQEKLSNKKQALQALKSSLKPESRVLTMLEREVEWLEGEQRQLEAHINRTETWGENLGKWRAIVQSADITEEKEPPLFVIVVHVLEKDLSDEDDGISTGWVVSRTLPQFQELHRKLRPLCSDVRNLELPSHTFKFLFGKTDKNSLDKAKVLIQRYLDFILEDDRLNQSEAVYSFLSPSSEHLKHTSYSPKKSKFSFSTLFKSSSSTSAEQSSRETSLFKESEDEDISQCLDASGLIDSSENTKTNGHFSKFEDRDTIAEPLYTLMSEIFNMQGVFKYLRKTLIAFVQVTYGRTINRQILDTISWCFSEQMLLYYISLILKSWWPSGTLAPKAPIRSEEEKLATQKEAREEFVSNVPEILITLVGANAAKSGAQKVFDTLQNKAMNKQLFYDLLEVVLSEIFPELKMNDS